MGICVSTVVGTDRSAQQVPLNNPEMEEPPEEIINRKNEVVLQQPSRTKDFDADDNPLPAAGCCILCLDPQLCTCCDCDCVDCVCCYWCLSCECCDGCDECCAECINSCC
ncbi:uncharacterized protein [Tenebrio molitor]|uniref:uncharacterized protein n=1 Tax=Tenebrio molitor TaxID=7067 RepID=UPI0036246A97